MLSVLAADKARLPGWPLGHPQSLPPDAQVSEALRGSRGRLHLGKGWELVLSW